MKLEEVFTYLSYSELSNTKFIDDNGNIKLEYYPKLITLVNLGVRDIHVRFSLLIKELNIDMYEHITNYYLKPDYAYTSTSNQPYKYIFDSPYDPFTGKVLQVLNVYTETGIELPLNVLNNPISVFTPSPDILQVSYPTNSASLNVSYKTYPDNINIRTNDLNTDVHLPDFLLEALVLFIASKVFSGVGVEKPEYVNYFTRYKNSLNEVEISGVFNKETSINTRLEDNQWE